MFIKLLVLFIFIPILEVYVLIEAGRQIGVAATIFMIVATGIAGAYLARSQGFELIRRIQKELNEGHLPAKELIDGAFILAGGILLLTPGFCTDLLGFFFLTPITRNLLKGWLQPWLQKKIQQGDIQINRF